MCVCVHRLGPPVGRTPHSATAAPCTNTSGTVQSLKTDTFYEPTAYEPGVYTSYEQIITFAGHEYKRAEFFNIKMRSLVQKL